MSKQIPLTVKAFGGPFTGLLIRGTSVFGLLSEDPVAKRQISAVAQRIRVGGDAAYATEAFDVAVIEGFENGQDLETLASGENRSSAQSGAIASYVKGTITLASQWTSTDATVTATARRILDLNNGNKFVCVAVGTKLRAYNVTTPGWSDKGTFASNAIHLFATDQYLFISCSTGDAFWRWDGTTFTQPKAGQKFNAMCMFKGSLYGVLGNAYYVGDAAGAKWSKASDGVGWANTSIDDLYVSGSLLCMPKPEGLFVFDGQNPPYMAIPSEELATAQNWVGGRDFEGICYLPLMGTMRKASGGFKTISGDVMPQVQGSTAKERYGHGFPKIVVAGPNAVYIATHQEEGLYPAVLRHNGIGFEQVYRGSSGATMNAAGFSRLMGRLYVNDGSTRMKDLLNAGQGEYPNFASTGWIETPWIDGGYPDSNKAFRDITLELEDCTSTETVLVSYYLDSASIVNLQTLSTSGKQTVLLGGADGVVEGKKIKFRFTLSRDSGDVTKTPKIKGKMPVRLIVTPAASDARTVQYILDLDQPLFNGFGKISDKYSTIGEQVDALEGLRETTGPITLVDEWGRFHGVKITDLSDAQRRVAGDKEKHTIGISYTDMFPGLKTHVFSTALITNMVGSTSA